jgi:S-adenosylmethionine-diacylglycerol 3-amino-3-carboxypropyl transferase
MRLRDAPAKPASDEKRLFSEINYSSANEDGASERTALSGFLEGASAVTITGSGARALDLLIARPSRLVTVDMNPAQNCLLELKVAAIRWMEYQDYIAFLGVTPSPHRAKIYRGLRTSLSPSARYFWDSRLSMIESGVIYSGRWEGYLWWMSRVPMILRPRKTRRLLYARNILSQRDVWNREWDGYWWKMVLKFLGIRSLWSRAIGEPGASLIPENVTPSTVIRNRFARASQHLHLRKCAFAWLMFTGRYNPRETLPCHLSREFFPALKEMVGVLEIKSLSLCEYLRATTDKFAAFSLSDFGSYAQLPVYQSTWRAVSQSSLSSGSKVVEREFLLPRKPEKIQGVRLSRNNALERTLQISDRSVVYDFITGIVEP